MSDARVRVGVVGIGVMGGQHARSLMNGEIEGAELTAVADVSEGVRAAAQSTLPGVPVFQTTEELLHADRVDAVIIATPHYQHPPLAAAVLKRGLHVLIEKPAGVFTEAVRALNEAAARTGTVFGIMYDERTHPVYAQVRQMVAAGDLGSIRRASWVITDWYRPQSYYDSGTWRGTWAGEGGGVLLNQCPHQLDLWQWILGMMPVRVSAEMGWGRYHRIEVEDDVTAYMEFANGATGTFIASTGEAPGTNRLEVVGENGKIVVEDGRGTFWRLRESEPAFSQRYRERFGEPAVDREDIVVAPRTREKHQLILEDWVRVIRRGGRLLAPGEEGIRGLTLSNAMHLSAWLREPVNLPLDEARFVALLKDRIRTSHGPREGLAGVFDDLL